MAVMAVAAHPHPIGPDPSPKRKKNFCDHCNTKTKREGYRCTAGCDFDLCAQCVSAHTLVPLLDYLRSEATAAESSQPAAEPLPEHLMDAGTPSVGWRIRAEQTGSGWAWDLRSLCFFSHNERLTAHQAVSSGCAGSGWAAELAVGRDGTWGGRQDEQQQLWLGAIFAQAAQVTSVSCIEPSPAHSATVVFLERLNDEGVWVVARELETDERAEEDDAFGPCEPRGPVPPACELVSRPSRELCGSVHDCCYRNKLHACAGGGDFEPNSEFFFSCNCEGLWVCVSRSCGEDTLTRACRLVRRMIPPAQRQLWSLFRSPLWAKSSGPMRLVVLDNRTDQQAGCIPELADDSEGRNCTSCPFVFTSREDFFEGVGDWPATALTAHEMVHGADMVIRQLIDPAFHDDVLELYLKHRDKFRYHEERANGSQAVKHLYAATNRDEFLAETFTILLGLKRDRKDYVCANMATPEALKIACPDLVELLETFFVCDV